MKRRMGHRRNKRKFLLKYYEQQSFHSGILHSFCHLFAQIVLAPALVAVSHPYHGSASNSVEARGSTEHLPFLVISLLELSEAPLGFTL